MRPKFNARAATVLTAAGALTMTMIAATRAPASAPAQPDSTLAMTITDRTLGYGQSLVVSGRAAATSAGRRLVLEYRPRGRDWGPVASTTAGADGRFRFRVRAERSGDARVRVADGAAATRSAGGATPAPDAGAAGPAQTVSVAGRFVGRWRSVDVDAGRVAVVRGALRPAVAGRTVTLERPGRTHMPGPRGSGKDQHILEHEPAPCRKSWALRALLWAGPLGTWTARALRKRYDSQAADFDPRNGG